MIELDIPGIKKIYAKNLVLDYNGTLAFDGALLPGVEEILNKISETLEVHVITADTFGKAAEQLKNVKCTLDIIGAEEQQKQKESFVASLGAESVIAIGNGFNDALMLKEAALGIAVVQKEGASLKAAVEADIITVSIADALELIFNPLRIAATLRN